MRDLSGKVAVVLGASAEGGTGWTIAEAMADAGAKVVVAARSLEPLKKLAKKLGGTAVQCDGGREEDIKNLRKAAMDAYGKIDIAVNSAAQPTIAMIENSTQELLEQGINVNYYGMVHFVREMAAAMSEGPGNIILISSMSATHPLQPHFAYACGKAATECLLKYAAQEYGPRKIRVNGIRIATVMSDMASEHFNYPGVYARFAHEVPLGRLGETSDMADAALWLAGADYVTGCWLDVCGGNHLHRFPFLSELPGEGDSYEGAGALHDRETGNTLHLEK